MKRADTVTACSPTRWALVEADAANGTLVETGWVGDLSAAAAADIHREPRHGSSAAGHAFTSVRLLCTSFMAKGLAIPSRAETRSFSLNSE